VHCGILNSNCRGTWKKYSLDDLRPHTKRAACVKLFLSTLNTILVVPFQKDEAEAPLRWHMILPRLDVQKYMDSRCVLVSKSFWLLTAVLKSFFPY
jgi:hypothetical protein